ncbi:hypothetical protein D3C80_1863310 [compost metagenome]
MHSGPQAHRLGANGRFFMRTVGGNNEVKDGAPLGFGLNVAKDSLSRGVPFQHYTLR